ncbi:MAG TPA: hypothetical protein O0X47_05465, partial [Methanocorpusculum sp.]|nr:hypothetical protein [Methanocorpusculum sp.]
SPPHYLLPIEIDLFSIAHNIHESVQWIHLALDSMLNVLITHERKGIFMAIEKPGSDEICEEIY